MHTITEKDWPDFRRLMQWWRSTSGRTATAAPKERPESELRSVIITKTLSPGSYAPAALLKRSPHTVYDLYIPNQSYVPPKFSVVIGDWTSPPIATTATAEELAAVLSQSPVADQILSVGLGGRLRRWRVETTQEINFQATSDDETPWRWLVRPVQEIEAGEELIAYSIRHDERPLPIGSQCTVAQFTDLGWGIVDAEQLNRPVDTTVIKQTLQAQACLPPVFEVGDTACPACNNNAPDAYWISSTIHSLDGSTSQGSSSSFISSESFGSITTAQLGVSPIVHDSGNVYKSDQLGPGDAYAFTLEIIEDAAFGAGAKLTFSGGGYQGGDVSIVYHANGPWDCLGVNQMRRLTHLCSSSLESIDSFPYCLTIRPQKPGCSAAGGFLPDAELLLTHDANGTTQETRLKSQLDESGNSRCFYSSQIPGFYSIRIDKVQATLNVTRESDHYLFLVDLVDERLIPNLNVNGIWSNTYEAKFAELEEARNQLAKGMTLKSKGVPPEDYPHTVTISTV